MIKLNYICLVLFFALLGKAHAQNSIRGEVYSVLDDSLSYDVSVYKADSTLVAKKLFSTRSFRLVAQGGDYLTIASPGYTTYTALLDKNRPETDIGTIELQLYSNLLETVVLTSERKNVTSRHGNLKFNIPATPLENSGTAVDAIVQLPGIMLSGDRLEVFGRGTPLIVIDEQESTHADLLMLRSEQIESVEILKNPGAQYDARNNTIIKITTRSQKYDGWNFAVRNLATKGRHFIYYGGIDVGYKKNRSRYYLHLSTNPNTLRKADDYYRNFKESNTIVKNRVVTDIRNPDNHNFRFNTLQQVNDHHSLYFQTSALVKESTEHTRNENIVITDNIPQGSIYTGITTPASNFNTVNNLIYTLRPDSLGGKVFRLNANYAYYRSENMQEISQTAGNEAENLLAGFYSRSQVYSVKPTMYLPFAGRSSLSAGVRYLYYHSKSDYTYQGFLQNIITEDNLAAYAEYDGSFKKFSYRAGLRYEWVNSLGRQNSEMTIIERKSDALFPSASVDYEISADLRANVSYARRVSRPNLNDLTSYNIFIDSLSSFVGNPRLIPSYSNVFNYSLTYKDAASLNVSYIKTSDPIFYDINYSGLATLAGPENFTSAENFSVSVNIPYKYKFWSTFNSLGVSSQSNTYREKGLEVSNTMFYSSLYNNFSLSGDLNINIMYQYNTAGLEGILKFEPRHIVNLNINKKFWNKRIEAFFQWQDIFNQQRYYISTSLPGLDVSNVKFGDTSFVRLGIVFKLNSTDDIKNNNDISNDEESRIKKQE